SAATRPTPDCLVLTIAARIKHCESRCVGRLPAASSRCPTANSQAANKTVTAKAASAYPEKSMRGTKPGLSSVASKKPSAVSGQEGTSRFSADGEASARASPRAAVSCSNTLTSDRPDGG